MNSRTRFLFALVCVLGLVLVPSLMAQTSNGTIAGTITDKTGGAVVKATVTATSQDLGTTLGSAITDGSGGYRIDALVPGKYTVNIKPAAFMFTVYFPGTRASIRYPPEPSVIALPRVVPRSWLVAVTVAFTTAPQVLSVIVPAIVPLLVCAIKLGTKTNPNTQTNAKRNLVLLFINTLLKRNCGVIHFSNRLNIWNVIEMPSKVPVFAL